MADRIEHAAAEAAGKVKEATGTATDNQSLEADGNGGDLASANVKQAGDKAGGAGKDVFGS